MNKPVKKKGAFSRVVQNGQKKVPTTASTKALLFTLGNEDHKRIAQLIAKWLEQDERKKSK
jgi:hypothetical protein